MNKEQRNQIRFIAVILFVLVLIMDFCVGHEGIAGDIQNCLAIVCILLFLLSFILSVFGGEGELSEKSRPICQKLGLLLSVIGILLIFVSLGAVSDAGNFAAAGDFAISFGIVLLVCSYDSNETIKGNAESPEETLRRLEKEVREQTRKAEQVLQKTGTGTHVNQKSNTDASVKKSAGIVGRRWRKGSTSVINAGTRYN